MHFTAIMGLKITEPPPNYDKRTRTNDGGPGGRRWRAVIGSARRRRPERRAERPADPRRYVSVSGGSYG